MKDLIEIIVYFFSEIKLNSVLFVLFAIVGLACVFHYARWTELGLAVGALVLLFVVKMFL